MQKINKHTKQQDKDICRVCGSELVNGVCSKCGWVQIVFPSVVPDSISKFNEKYISAMKRCLVTEKSVANFKNELESSKDALKKLTQDANRLKADKNNLSIEIKTAHQRINELELSLKAAEKNMVEQLPCGFYVSKEKDFIGETDNNGQKSGVGISRQCDGDFYVGQWEFDLKTGMGVEIKHNGKKYAGEFRTNRQTGVGVILNNNGSKYAGECKNGKRHGGGVTVNANGEKMYVNYEEDKINNSSGAYFMQDGSIICGQMSENGPTGMCIRYYPNGTTRRESWRNGIIQL